MSQRDRDSLWGFAAGFVLASVTMFFFLGITGGF